MPQTIVQPPTDDDLVCTPGNGQRYGIIDGEMIVSASPTRAHRIAAQHANLVLADASARGRLGIAAFAPVDVRPSPHDIVEPDLLFVRRERPHRHTDIGVGEGPPGTIGEIFSRPAAPATSSGMGSPTLGARSRRTGRPIRSRER